MSDLWHVSENGSIDLFRPRADESHDSPEPLVWAIDDEHVPAYWFPRECPRGTFWAVESTSAGAWLPEVRAARIFAYRLPPESFTRYERAAGYWVSRSAVEPLEVIELGDLLAKHAAAGIELRIVPALAPLWERVVASTLEFSGIRLRNLGRRGMV